MHILVEGVAIMRVYYGVKLQVMTRSARGKSGRFQCVDQNVCVYFCDAVGRHPLRTVQRRRAVACRVPVAASFVGILGMSVCPSQRMS